MSPLSICNSKNSMHSSPNVGKRELTQKTAQAACARLSAAPRNASDMESQQPQEPSRSPSSSPSAAVAPAATNAVQEEYYDCGCDEQPEEDILDQVCSCLLACKNRLFSILINLALLVVFLALFRFTFFFLQRDGLRCALYHSTRVLSGHGLEHWADFGALLGLVREHDMIWGEVDADISLLEESRARIDDADVRAALHAADFAVLEDRAGSKMRWHTGYGFISDVDVWATDKNGTRSLADKRIQMTTFRLDPAMYNLPQHWVLPTAQLTIPSEPFRACLSSSTQQQQTHISFNTPSDPHTYLSYWYGDDYMIPKKFFKGRDRSLDWREQFLWTYAVWIFEIFVACKVAVRLVTYGSSYHASITAYHIGCFVCAPIAACILARVRVRARKFTWTGCPLVEIAFALFAVLCAAVYVSARLHIYSALLIGAALLYVGHVAPKWVTWKWTMMTRDSHTQTE